MKPEPLKDKYKEYAHDLWADLITKERLGQEATEIFTDIRLAVEWLKEELNIDLDFDEIQPKQEKKVFKLIDKAFEDVIKK